MLTIAKLETEETVIGIWDEKANLIKQCMYIDVADIDDSKYSVGMFPIFEYFSDDLIDIDTDLVLYKTHKPNHNMSEQYYDLVKKIAKKEKIKSTLIDINSNVSKRKKT